MSLTYMYRKDIQHTDPPGSQGADGYTMNLNNYCNIMLYFK